jgi:hypothetical protein
MFLCHGRVSSSYVTLVLPVYLERQEQHILTMWPLDGTEHQSCWWETPSMEGKGDTCKYVATYTDYVATR